MERREQEISQVTVWGAIVNIALSGLKLLAGILGHSAAMLADAVHSLSDLVSDAVVLIMVRIASKGQDKSHDYGHGKFETLATVIVAILLLVVGGKLMAEGIGKIVLVAKGGILDVPGNIALIAAIVSIIVKEALFQWTVLVGKKNNSPAVITNAWHHRTDALSSIGAAIGIGAAIIFGGKFVILDPIVCCIISIFIILIAVQMAVPALKELTESSLPDDVEDEISGIIQSVDGVRNVHDLKTRKSGPDIIIDSHLVVDPEMTVAKAHAITEIAESALRSKYGEKTQISLHVEPSDDC